MHFIYLDDVTFQRESIYYCKHSFWGNVKLLIVALSPLNARLQLHVGERVEKAPGGGSAPHLIMLGVTKRKSGEPLTSCSSSLISICSSLTKALCLVLHIYQC